MRDEAGAMPRTRPVRLVARAAAIWVVIGAIAIAAGGHAAAGQRVAPVTDPVVKKECGSCHMAFSPEFLPRRSWQKLVDTLSDHFGENASLGDAEGKKVLDYLLANAGDGAKAGSEGRKFSASIRRTDTPLRITEVPRWVKEHREVPAAKWTDPKVKSKANCVACHRAADQGIFED